MGVPGHQNVSAVIHPYPNMGERFTHRTFAFGSRHVQCNHGTALGKPITLIKRQADRAAPGKQVGRNPSATNRQKPERITVQLFLFGRRHQRHSQFRHQNQGLRLVFVDALHQPADVQPTASGHAQILQGCDHYRTAHKQWQINPGNVLQQCGQWQDAQVPLKVDALKTLLQGQRGGRHLGHRQADALRVACTAGRKGYLRGLLRHPGGCRCYRQMP